MKVFHPKNLLRVFARRFGYRFSRISEPLPVENAFQAMQRLLGGVEEPVIFDVGSHCGHVCRIFREVFPRATIYAFEPFPASFQQLRENMKEDRRTRVFPFGFGDRIGKLAFHSNPSSENNSLLASDEGSVHTWGAGLFETRNIVEAEFRTLDAVVDELKLSRVDVLKIDVQGAQHLVMAGGAGVFSKGQVGLVYSEIITQPTYKGQKRLDEALAPFYDAGFDLYNFYNPSFTSDGRLRQVDAIFTKVGS